MEPLQHRDEINKQKWWQRFQAAWTNSAWVSSIALTHIWEYFLRSGDREGAKCGWDLWKPLSPGEGRGEGSTSAMGKHLKLKHKDDAERRDTPDEVPTYSPGGSNTRPITSYFLKQKPSLERVLSELAACDKISFRTVAPSKRIRGAFHTKFPPSSMT